MKTNIIIIIIIFGLLSQASLSLAIALWEDISSHNNGMTTARAFWCCEFDLNFLLCLFSSGQHFHQFQLMPSIYLWSRINLTSISQLDMIPLALSLWKIVSNMFFCGQYLIAVISYMTWLKAPAFSVLPWQSCLSFYS